MQILLVVAPNGATCCKLWPKTISGMDRTRTMGVVVQGPPAVFPWEKQVFPWEKRCVLGWETLYLGFKTMGVVVQVPPAFFPREK